jgi:hypothetical protein
MTGRSAKADEPKSGVGEGPFVLVEPHASFTLMS